MYDRGVFEVAHGVDQLLAKALQHVQRQPAVFAQQLRQRHVTGAFEQQGGAAGHGQALADLNDVGVAQLGQGLGLGSQVVVVRGVDGHLEDQRLVAAIRAHQQRVAGRTAAHALDDGEATLDAVVNAGLAGVGGGLGVGRGQLVLDPVQIVQKTADAVVAGQHIGLGGVLHQLVQAQAAAVQHIGQAQALVLAQLGGQLDRGRGRWLATEDVEGQAAERKHVQLGAVGGVGQGGLGGEVDPVGVIDVVLDMLGAGGAVQCAGAA